MRCQNCGAELEDGVLFCRECGSRVGAQETRFCRECGAEIPVGATECEYCGAQVDIPKTPFETPASHNPIDSVRSRFADVTSAKGGIKINKLIIPIVCVSVVLLVFSFGCVRSFLSKQSKNAAAPSIPEYVSSSESDSANSKAEKGTQYAYMSDEWNVYIATAISDSIFKIENWDKTFSGTESVSLNSDLGAYKIDDKGNDFHWIDDEHTAFVITFSDKNNSRVSKPEPHVFTININDGDKYKGSNYDKSIACYQYKNDSWHYYRAIPLTDRLIKIECWSCTFADTDPCYGWDWCVIDTENTNTGFEWTDDEHTSFTMTTIDPDNGSYWKEPTFVVFELENPKFKYSTVKEYLEAK